MGEIPIFVTGLDKPVFFMSKTRRGGEKISRTERGIYTILYGLGGAEGNPLFLI